MANSTVHTRWGIGVHIGCTLFATASLRCLRWRIAGKTQSAHRKSRNAVQVGAKGEGVHGMAHRGLKRPEVQRIDAGDEDERQRRTELDEKGLRRPPPGP